MAYQNGYEQKDNYGSGDNYQNGYSKGDNYKNGYQNDGYGGGDNYKDGYGKGDNYKNNYHNRHRHQSRRDKKGSNFIIYAVIAVALGFFIAQRF